MNGSDEELELGPSDTEVSGVSTTSTTATTTIVHENYPVVTEKYFSADNLFERVVVMVSLPGGASNVQIDLNDDGSCMLVKYVWPNASYAMDNLYQKKLQNKSISLQDPQVLAIERGLSKIRSTVDSAPASKIVINLPIKVQTEPSTWTKNGIMRTDGTQLIMADFKGHCKSYNKKVNDANVQFDM